MNKKFSCLLFSLVSLLTVISCELGLGKQVDVSAPVAAITYPPKEAVITGPFVLAGTCSDDLGVNKVIVTVEQTESNVKYESVKAVVVNEGSGNSDGSWKLEIDPFDFNGTKLLDGKYSATIKAHDRAGHTTSDISIPFTIDNTAPIFIVKNPASITDSEPSKYGSQFKVEGYLVDDTSYVTMAATVYDESNNCLGTFTVEDINTSDSASIEFASLNSSDEEIRENFTKIYGGDEASGEKKFYLSLKITDSAKVYNDPTENVLSKTLSGNSTTRIYKYDVYSELMGKKSTYQLTTRDIKKIINGTYSSSSESEGRSAITIDDLTQIKYKLSDLSFETEVAEDSEEKPTHLVFSLDKNANPTYSLTGYSFTEISSLESLTASSNAKLTLKVQVGKNETNIKSETANVYLFGPYDSVTTDEIAKHMADPASYYENEKDLTAVYLFEGAKNGTSTSQDGFDLQLELPDLKATKKYFIAVTGEDEDGEALIASDGLYFGFSGQSSNIPPSLTILSPASESQLMALTKVSGSISSTDTEISSTDTVTYKVNVYNMNAASSTTAIKTESGTVSIIVNEDDKKSGTWSFDISTKADDQAYYKYELEITGSISGNPSKTVKQQFFVDSSTPEFVNTDASIPSKWLQNKTQKLKVWVGSSLENYSGIKSVTYSIGSGSVSGELQLGAKTDINGKEDSSGNYNLYSSNVDLSEGINQITFTLEDYAGHKKTFGPFEYKIDTAVPTELSASADDVNLNISESRTAQTVSVSAKDSGSGVEKIEILKNGSVYATSTELSGTEVSGKVTVPANTAIYSEGKNTFTARVTDAAGNVSEVTYEVNVDLTLPQPGITSHSSGTTVNKTILLKGKAQDNNTGLSADELYVYDASSKSWSKAADITLSSDNTWTASLDTTKYSGEIKLNFVFEDSFGNKNASSDDSADLTLKIDQNTDRPVLKLTNIERKDTKLSQSKTVYGTVSDDDGIVKGIWVTSDATLASNASSYPTLSLDNGWKKVSLSSSTWSCDADNEGETSWYFYVLDAEGSGFTTSASSQEKRPYVNGMSDTSNVDNNTAVSFTADLTPPKVNVKVSHTNGEYAERTTAFGKTNNTVYLKVEVVEEVGMSTTPITFESGMNAVLLSSEHTEGSDTYIYYYTLNAYESDAFTEGNNIISVSAKDASLQTGIGTVSISVDKTVPVVKIISPTTNEKDAVTSSITMTGNVTDNSTISVLKYLIPTNDQIKAASVTSSTSGWVTMPSSVTWSIDFTSVISSKNSLLYYVQDSRVLTEYGEKTETENVYKLPVYFYAEDIAGNGGIITDQYVLVDSDSGKPKAWINTPSNGDTTSGIVTVYGGASDNIYVDEVWLQIDADNDGNFTQRDVAYIENYWSGTDVYANLEGGSTDDNWYIKVSGTNNWKRAVDTDKIQEKDGTRTLRMRVKSWDNEGNSREWTDKVEVCIDSLKPVVSDLRLVKYADDGTTETASREYISGMYINNSSTWYLTGKITDNEKVASVIFNKIDSTTQIVNGFVDMTKKEPSSASYDLKCQLPTDVSGIINVSIVAADNKGNEVSQSILVNIDSACPSVYTKDDIEVDEDTSELRIKSLGENLDASSNMIADNNGWFTFGDTVVDAGSGLDYIAFYIQKTLSSAKYVYDPMTSSANKTQITGDIEVNSDGLVVKTLSSVTRSSEDSLTSASLKNNTNIHIGGLVKIGGSYSKIDSYDSDSGKITFSPTVPVTYTSAQVVYAQIVDHLLTESFTTSGGITEVTNDDGDGMRESISVLGSAYTWTASVKSTNIPDGPAELHVVVIDKAGNVTSGIVNTYVSNQRPRITKVLLGTDLNGNSYFDFKAAKAPVTSINESQATPDDTEFGEFNYYSAIDSISGKAQSVVTLNSSAFKVKNNFCILPEFTGGNTGLKYVMKTGKQTAGVSGTVTALTSASSLKLKSTGSALVTDQVSSYGGIYLTSAQCGSTDGDVTLSFTFWDETEGTVQGTSSQWALLNIPVEIAVNDEVAPEPKITPFYWKSKNDNSVYKDSDGNLLGHIELEADLPSTTFTSANSGLYDLDPKVSGKIIVEGSVYDNTRLKEIKFTAGNLFTSSTSLASYSAGEWTNASTFPTGVLSFTINDEYITQAGHMAKWTMVLDTEKLSPMAQTDQVITVSASDWKDRTSGSVSYKVDVVPYVTEVWTPMTDNGYSTGCSTLYSRSSTGEYPVSVADTVKLYGFNLNASSYTTDMGTKGTIAENTDNQTQSTFGFAKGSYYIPVTLGASENSGALTVSVNGIPAINNLNDNDARGEADEDTVNYKDYYNRQPNGANNNKLTDDVKLDVWQFKNVAEPVGSAASYVHMKVGPYLSGNSNSGRIGFSYKNAIGYFNMPGKKYSSSDSSGSSGIKLIIPKSKVGSYTYAYIYQTGGTKLVGDWPGKQFTNTSYFTSDSSNYYYDNASVSNIYVILNNGGDSSKTGDLGPYSGIYTWNGSSFNRTGDYSSSAGTGGIVYSQTRFGTNFGGFNNNTFTFDASGNAYGVAQCPDTSGKVGMSGNLQFFSRQVGSDATTNSMDLNYNYKNVANARRIESTSYYVGSTVYTDELRAQSPSMATYIDGSTTYVYLAYYDHGLDMIKFRLGSVGSTSNDIGLGLQDLTGSTTYPSGTENDNDKIGNANDLWDSLSSSYVGNKGSAYKYVYNLSGTGTKYAPSENVAIGALNDGTAVVSWYDKTNERLVIKYTKLSSLTSTGASWYSQVISTKGGKNVALAVDNDNGLHFAYSSNSGADLMYSYYKYSTNASNNGFTAVAKDILVDAYDNVGNHCSIDVGRTSTTSPWIPYISYRRDASAVSTKVAYPVFAEDATNLTAAQNGANADGTFTGAWSVSTVPSSNNSISDLVGIGIVKDWTAGSGIIHNFESGTDSSASDSGTYTICKATLVHGNGTANPVLGYGVEDGFIEMAQKR